MAIGPRLRVQGRTARLNISSPVSTSSPGDAQGDKDKDDSNPQAGRIQTQIHKLAPIGLRSSRNQFQSRNTDVGTSAPTASVDVHTSSRSGSLPSLGDVVQNRDNFNIRSASNQQKRKRGRSYGESIQKAIARNGGKKLEIEFPENLARPLKNASSFATGIGIIVRHHAPVKHIRAYDDIPEANKQQLLGGLMAWFEIKDFQTDPAVKDKLDNMFHICYLHWRHKMHKAYKGLKEAGQNPKDACPFDWFVDEDWDDVCDSFEEPKFKRRSSVNQDNRKKLPYTHASGSQSFHVRYHNMVETERSHVGNWKQCHTLKNGRMVNHQAELLAEEMENRKRQRKEAGDCVVEEDILCETLGRRAGYLKGLGYGFMPPRSTNHSRRHDSDALRTAQDLLQEQQSWLVRQQKEIENQNSIITEQNSTIATMVENQKRLEEKVEKILAAFTRI